MLSRTRRLSSILGGGAAVLMVWNALSGGERLVGPSALPAGATRDATSPDREPEPEAVDGRADPARLEASRRVRVPKDAPPTRGPSHTLYAGYHPAVAQVLDLSDHYGVDGEVRYIELIGKLRVKARESAQALADALATLPAEQRFGHRGRRLIYALGHIGDPVALDTLREIALAPTPPLSSSDQEHGIGGPRSEHASTAVFALHAMRRVAGHDRTPTVVARVYDVLNHIMSHEDSSPHVVATASMILRRHATDESAELSRQADLVNSHHRFVLDINTGRVAP